VGDLAVSLGSQMQGNDTRVANPLRDGVYRWVKVISLNVEIEGYHDATKRYDAAKIAPTSGLSIYQTPFTPKLLPCAQTFSHDLIFKLFTLSIFCKNTNRRLALDCNCL